MMLGYLNRVLLLGFAFQILASQASDAQPTDASRSVFVSELSRYLLGSSEQFAAIDGGDGGWRGIMLSPPGTTLPPISIGEDQFAAGQESLGRTLAVGNFVDRTVLNQNGYAVRSNTTIGEVWELIVKETVPKNLASETTTATDILFLRPNAVETATGIKYLREPSEEMQKFLYYEDLASVLLQDGDAWSYHPRLEEFSGKEEALNAVLRDWGLFGYRSEVGHAINALENSVVSSSFRAWSVFEHKFASNQIRVDQYISVPRTFFSPAPSNWLNLGSWLRAQSFESSGNGLTYEMAVIEVVRPWMDLDALINEDVRIENPSFAPISLGTTPTAMSLPEGRASTIVESLILVRNIRIAGAPAEQWISQHPLRLFAYPESINIVGFIVRVLPEIGAN